MVNKLILPMLVVFSLILVELSLPAQTITLKVRDVVIKPNVAYLEGSNVIARCLVGTAEREMVLPRLEKVFVLTVGEGPENLNPFTCTVSKRDIDSTPLALGVYRVQCAANGAVCLPWYKCDGAGCRVE